MKSYLEISESERIKDVMRPLIAQEGVFPVLIALADRLTEDSSAVLERYETRNHIAERMSVELECVAGAIREAVSRYQQDSLV